MNHLFRIFLASLLAFACALSQEPSRPITFALVGDIMLGSDFPNGNRLPPDEGRELFSEAKEFLLAADVAVGNLECPITTVRETKKVAVPGMKYVFRMPKYLAPRLAEAGFDVLSTANNHARDFGLEGRLETEKILDSLGIKHTGRRGDIANLEIRGTTIAVIGFYTNAECFSLLDIPDAVATVESLSKVNDIVVVSFHGGAEGVEETRLPEGNEEFLGDNRGNLRLFARSVVDAGADIVFGHGPHVPRAIEIYNGKIIAYSLGNFCTWWGISVSGACGLAPLLWAELDCEGNILGLKIISFEQMTKHYPIIDFKKRAEKLILDLSRKDISELPKHIFDLAQEQQ